MPAEDYSQFGIDHGYGLGLERYVGDGITIEGHMGTGEAQSAYVGFDRGARHRHRGDDQHGHRRPPGDHGGRGAHRSQPRRLTPRSPQTESACGALVMLAAQMGGAMSESSNAVFISYRREVSWTLVEALYQRLSDAGIDAFYDIENIRAGKFEDIILDQIRARPYFLLVLVPGALDRCGERNDWLTREIETAIEADRMIIPVHTPTFELSTVESALPDGLGHKLAAYQAVELPHKYFKFAVNQLVEEYLIPRTLEIIATPIADQADVARIQRAAAKAPAVTQEQLSAHYEYFERAHLKFDEQDYAGVIADLTEAIRIYPDDAFAFYNRGIARYSEGDVEGAITDLTEVVRLDPDYEDAFFNRAVARADSGDWKGAITDYTEAIRLYAEYAEAFANRGVARSNTGDIKGAITDYSEAIRLDPGLANAFFNRGLAYMDEGQTENAIADFRQGQRLAPEDPDFGRKLRELAAD